VCRKRNEIGVNTLTFDYIVDDLKRIIGSQSASIQEILSQTSQNETDVISVINYLLDHKKIAYTGAARLVWNT